jgi:pSer/pThr/pTyr-binding forkhead associated (FHA) protein
MGGGNTCPNCGTPFVPGTAFCDNCGAQLPVGGAGAPPMTPPPQQFTPPPPQFTPPAQQFPPQQFAPQQLAVGAPPPMPARLMVGGQSISVPQKAEVILGRGDVASNVFPDVDLTPYGASPQTGVSRKHARLIYQGAWMIEDLNSTNGTRVRGTQIPAGQRTPINNGDALTIGTLQLTFYTS